MASSLLKKGNDLIRAEGFYMDGSNLVVNNNALKINADSYNFQAVILHHLAMCR
jgi:hypothetical protein